MQGTIMGIVRSAAVFVVAVSVAACSVDKQEPPSLIGPSGFAQSITMTATPDTLPRDGSSQTVITVAVRDESGQPVSGRRLTLGTTAGTLSQSDVVTGNDGRVSFTLTAPAPGSTGNTVEVFATPVGGDANNAVTRTVSIALTGISNSTAPAPQFTVTPPAPGVGELVTFDASTTTDEGGPCGNACTYSWNFGEGTTRSGRIVTHRFGSAGTFTVVLTVTDAAGTTATRQQTLTVLMLPSPTVTFTVSPAAPVAGQQTTFTATATAAPGHSISRFTWNFGDGSAPQTTTSPSITKVFESTGTRVVTVTATDDLGQTGSFSAGVNVTSGVTVDFTISPEPPVVGQTVRFDPFASTIPAGVSVQEYRWDFGNGETATTTAGSPIASTRYQTAQTFNVRLTIVDTQGRTTTRSKPVTVTDPRAEQDRVR
jgi:PKD repeat protein